jgi:hypothetical protein
VASFVLQAPSWPQLSFEAVDLAFLAAALLAFSGADFGSSAPALPLMLRRSASFNQTC